MPPFQSNNNCSAGTTPQKRFSLHGLRYAYYCPPSRKASRKTSVKHLQYKGAVGCPVNSFTDVSLENAFRAAGEHFLYSVEFGLGILSYELVQS